MSGPTPTVRARLAPPPLARSRPAERPLTIAIVAALVPALALGAGFDPTTNKVDLEGAALWIDFENPARVPVTVYDANANPRPAVTEDDGPHAIEGHRSLRITGATPILTVDLAPIREAMVGRRIEVRLWQRPLGTRLTGDLRWDVQSYDLGALTLQPTGAVTTDGWEEWTTGPVDFAFDDLTPRRLVLYDQQYFSAFSLDSGLAVALDAVAVIDAGPARTARGACRITRERGDCGEHGACAFGRCVDAAALLGAPLYDARLRADALARRTFEVRTFEGGREPRALSAGFAQIVGWIADPATSVTDYWTTLRTAYDSLGDGHATPPSAGISGTISGGACAYYSEADLLPDRPSALMVYETVRGHRVGERLQVGDVIRSIDGLTPDAWSRHARRLLPHPGDHTTRAVQLAPHLLGAALATGAQLEVDRCPRRPDNAAIPCRTLEVQHLRLDLAALAQEAFARGDLASLLRGTTCDFRLRRPVRDDRSGRDEAYAGFTDRDGIREIQLNAVPGDARWRDVIDRAIDAPHPRVLLDQRLGGGGRLSSAELLASRLLAHGDLMRAELWTPLGVDETPTLRSALLACTDATIGGCSGLIPLLFREQDEARGVAARARLALLNGYDVSGNDVTTYALALRREGPTRIYGPSATYGAFGPITTLPRLPGDTWGGSIQSHDTVFLAPGDQHFHFTTGTGVLPTTVLLQRQSDAIRGVDTVLEAARAWLREG